MLGITSNQEIGSVVPLGTGTFYLYEEGDQDPKLRPNWLVTFTKNSEWHPYALNFFCTKCHQLNASCTKASMDDRKDTVIMKNIGDLFKKHAKLYKDSASSPEKTAAQAGVKQIKRRHQRKIKVRWLTSSCFDLPIDTSSTESRS